VFEERLAARAMRGGGMPTARPDPSAVLNDVLAHLGELMNVRQGAVMTRPDYGMPDINTLLVALPDTLGALRSAIARQIERFEPRLTNVVVRHQANPDNPLRLVFAITADLLLGERRQSVAFATAIENDGRMRLST
jgi:type VI secretion system protein